MTYQAPLADLRFMLHELVDFSAAVADPDMFNEELALTIYEEAGKFAAGVLEPLNALGDRAGLSLNEGVVTTPDGFADAWAQMCANGWNNMALPEAYGGQNLPWMISSLATEMFSSANKAFTMCPG
ncbi:MAG: acyl-CoA dehydrogenase family protein, partial [Oceanobacter sp.]